MRKNSCLLFLWVSCLNLNITLAQNPETIHLAVNNSFPSKSIYFDWINRNWNGSNEKKIEANLKFFKWLHGEYGMQLDIYLMDAADIDQGPNCAPGIGLPAYGSLETTWFQKRYPHGFGPLAELAKSFNCQLGVWLGPDGYGKTPGEAAKRKEMLVKFCRDYNFALFKFDACCSDLSTENQQYFIETLKECRRFSPDLIVLNHRITLNEDARKQTTTFLWEGRETYVDVNISNDEPAPHHRAANLSRGLPPNLSRLTEDHGVCLSSALDAWDDDLILQAFNRNLILSPEIYGNPFFLNDENLPRLARIYNIHRLYNNILVNGIQLPEDKYGKFAVSRGDDKTRLITLRNLSWQPLQVTIRLDKSVGLQSFDDVEVIQYHPVEKYMGTFKSGSEVTVTVLPFRTSLIKLSSEPDPEFVLKGTAYQVVKNIPGQPALVNLLGAAGEKNSFSLSGTRQKYRKASLNGEDISAILSGDTVEYTYPGQPKEIPFLKKMGNLQLTDLPENTGKYIETCNFTVDNNALEVRELLHSGETRFAPVQVCRDVFFNDTLFSGIGTWDKYAFDANMSTSFKVRLYDYNELKQNNGSFRLDLGQPELLDRIVFKGIPADYNPEKVEISSDLTSWIPVEIKMMKNEMHVDFSKNNPFRYLRLAKSPSEVAEIEGFSNQKPVERKLWRASNLFDLTNPGTAKLCWKFEGKLTGVGKSANLTVTVPANCSEGTVFAWMVYEDKIIAATDRAPSFLYNNWEHFGLAGKNLTFYIPVDEKLEGKTIQVMLLSTDDKLQKMNPEVWLSNQSIYEKAELKLE